MKAYTLFQTDIWKTKSSRVFCGVFTTYKKAFKAPKKTTFSALILPQILSNAT